MLSKKLKQLRQSRQLSQKELGNILNISNATLSLYETNERKPDIDTTKKIADYFNVTSDYLLDRTDDPKGTVTQSEKTEKDIAKTMAKLKEQLLNENDLMFDGEALSEETKELLLRLLEKDEIAATLNNKKYVPKKYRK